MKERLIELQNICLPTINKLRGVENISQLQERVYQNLTRHFDLLNICILRSRTNVEADHCFNTFNADFDSKFKPDLKNILLDYWGIDYPEYKYILTYNIDKWNCSHRDNTFSHFPKNSTIYKQTKLKSSGAGTMQQHSKFSLSLGCMWRGSSSWGRKERQLRYKLIFELIMHGGSSSYDRDKIETQRMFSILLNKPYWFRRHFEDTLFASTSITSSCANHSYQHFNIKINCSKQNCKILE